MGLSTAYGTVRQSGGIIRLFSEPGRGTTFRIYLPRVEARAEPTEATPTGLVVTPGGRETVLLVEDEPSVRLFTAMELEDLGYNVIQAQNGPEAILKTRCHEGPIDLILTDVVLPGEDGRRVFETILADRPALRVLYMSGHAEKHVVHRGVLEPGTEFLGKPFTTEQLALKVRRALSGKGADPPSAADHS